ncbi:MAG: TetR/AcrR family transcriptional regulator [Bacteroidota bacterium]
MVNTKQKIIRAATELYNNYGVASVRLQQIADLAGLSIGNLAYHFKSKEVLTLVVFQSLSEEVKEILKIFRQTPDLLDFDRQLGEWFSFQQQYAFYFSDHTPWPDEEIQHIRTQSFSRLISQVQKRFDFHCKRGTIQPNGTPDNYQIVAETVSMLITLWPSQCGLKGTSVDDEKKYKKAIWSQFRPYLTSRGLAEYNELIQPLLSPTNQ